MGLPQEASSESGPPEGQTVKDLIVPVLTFPRILEDHPNMQ
jgi:hypothetical protein